MKGGCESKRRSRRYAFVLPRFGDGIVGGEVTLVGRLAAELHRRGNPVEVFATCARDNRTWENTFPEGSATAFGLPVHRFKVDARNLDVWIPKQISISEGMNLSPDDQLDWMQHSVNSTGLYKRIFESKGSFDAYFFAPYLFGTTFWGSLIHPELSFLIPCLHDEYYAYTDVVASMFRQVAGAVFNAPPEHDLARRLYGEVRGGSVGMGFDPLNERDVSGLEPFFAESFPYLLYVGRKETGKNAQLLVDYFIELKERGCSRPDLRLVVAGGGSFDDLHRPEALRRKDVVDVGCLSEEDKRRLIRHATCLCQPSVNESFSIVLMEAWLLGIPVAVHADCAVTRYQVQRASGGLYFSSAVEFGAVVEELLGSPELRRAMAAAGKRYVEDEYNWDAVITRFDDVMEGLLT